MEGFPYIEALRAHYKKQGDALTLARKEYKEAEVFTRSIILFRTVLSSRFGTTGKHLWADPGRRVIEQLRRGKKTEREAYKQLYETWHNTNKQRTAVLQLAGPQHWAYIMGEEEEEKTL